MYRELSHDPQDIGCEIKKAPLRRDAGEPCIAESEVFMNSNVIIALIPTTLIICIPAFFAFRARPLAARG
jgi:hypothetical protein